jgi:hypothetical protein
VFFKLGYSNWLLICAFTAFVTLSTALVIAPHSNVPPLETIPRDPTTGRSLENSLR